MLLLTNRTVHGTLLVFSIMKKEKGYISQKKLTLPPPFFRPPPFPFPFPFPYPASSSFIFFLLLLLQGGPCKASGCRCGPGGPQAEEAGVLAHFRCGSAASGGDQAAGWRIVSNSPHPLRFFFVNSRTLMGCINPLEGDRRTP